MEYQKLLIAFCFYSHFILFVHQSQLTYAGQHLCARDEAFYLLQFQQGLTVDLSGYDCDYEARAKTLSWNVTGDCCQWDGVTCHGFTGHVIGLDLSCSFLNGTINANSSLTKLSHLQRLNLAFNKLSNFPLGDSISELESLTYLNLSNSVHMIGEKQIPQVLSNLSKLVSLDLSSYYTELKVDRKTFRSLLQDLTNLEVLLLDNADAPFELPKNLSSSLRYLSLERTGMFGNISEFQIFHLPNLQVLRLGQNPLLTGTLPIFNRSSNGRSVLELDFFYTGISGKVPDSIGNLHSLWYLNLQNCHLSGSIPESIGNLTAIRELILSENDFTGNVPSTVSKLNKLVRLDLSSNSFRGSILEYIDNLTAITQLTIPDNSFTGNVPSTIGKLNKLNYLNLENNFLQGPLHLSFCDMYSLVFLILARNNFSGSIPGCLGNSSISISALDLRMNNLHGEIPRFLSTGLQYLGLYGNQLGGQVPRSLVNCTSLEALDLGNNKINDTFPIWLQKLPNLQVLILKSNLFHGPIGDLESEFPFPELRIFDLSFNGFTGTLPSNFFKNFRGMISYKESTRSCRSENRCRRDTSNDIDYLYHVSLVIKGNEFDMRITPIMTSVDISSNRFEGYIPNSIGNLSSLVLLNLSHNSFRGHIPAEFAKLQQLEALDLSWNKLIGDIPDPLSSLTFLEVLNLSYNHLAGRIPLGKQFNTFPNDSYCGNPDLCGFPLSKECGNSNDSPLKHDDDDSFFASGFTWQAVVIGYGCGMIFGLLMGGLMFLLEKPKWFVNFAEDIAQQIAAKKRTRQKKRRQRHEVAGELDKFISKLVLMFWQIAMDASVCSLNVPNTYVNVTVYFYESDPCLARAQHSGD
ncbi:receptor-like protein 9DC3 [Solanum verrucosum]|uniref:receptor-like protein 9DC3 n=1 Tax=Solanum verrucosum TaxID=315347 RepID=UPI0020D16CC7|nr:receptor-like protein 9DC3 [Solanum verrucosum]